MSTRPANTQAADGSVHGMNSRRPADQRAFKALCSVCPVLGFAQEGGYQSHRASTNQAAISPSRGSPAGMAADHTGRTQRRCHPRRPGAGTAHPPGLRALRHRRLQLRDAHRSPSRQGATLTPDAKASRTIAGDIADRPHSLKDPYYIGIVRYKGMEYPGKHEAIVPEELFFRVQDIIRAHSISGDKRRIHQVVGQFESSAPAGNARRSSKEVRWNLRTTR